MLKTPRQPIDEQPPQRGKGLPWRVLAWLFFLAITAYVVLFCLATPIRRYALLWSLMPDALVGEWFGNDPTRCSLLDRIPLLLVAGLILAVAFLVGRLVLDVLRIAPRLTALERFVFAVGLGLNLLSLLTLACGLAGQLHSRWWFVSVTLAASLLAWVRCRPWRASASQAPEEDLQQEASSGVPARAAFTAAVPFAVVILLGGMVRPWYFDVREYHLQVPKEFFQQGYVGFLPHNVYGNMPLGAEMHALLSMVLFPGPDAWWWGAMAGKTVIAALAPLGALAVYAFGRRYFSRTAGAFAALVFLSTPWIAHVSMAGLNEGASAFYYLLALHATWLWADQRRTAVAASASGWQFAALAGFMAGAAVACKYPAVLFLVVPLLGWIAWQLPSRSQALAATAFLVAVLSGCGLWLGKNWVLSGNPTYPLLYPWFDGTTRTPQKDIQWARAHGVPYSGAGDRFTVQQFCDSLSLVFWKSDYASPLLVPFAVAGLLTPHARRRKLLLAALCAFMFILWWCLTHRVDRFLLPALPCVTILAGEGATWASAKLSRRGVICLFAACLVFNLLCAGNRTTSDNRYFVSLRALRADLPHHQDPDYSQVQQSQRYVNQAVRPGFRLLAVGEAQVFDIEVPVLYNTCFDDCIFEQLMRGRTREQRYAALRDHRISHMLFAWRELDRYRSPGNYGYSPYVTRELVRGVLAGEQQLLRRVMQDGHEDNVEVFEVLGWETW